MQLKYWFYGRVRQNKKISGVRTTKDGYRELGWATGLETDISNLFHEMSHMVMCDEEHLLSTAWGMEIKNVKVVQGREYPNPRTSQAARNEMEVVAVQALIANHFGIKTDFKTYASVIYDFVPGSLFLKYDYGMCELKGEEVIEHVPYNLSEKLVKKVMVSDIVDMMNDMDFETIKSEWFRRVQVITEKLEDSVEKAV